MSTILVKRGATAKVAAVVPASGEPVLDTTLGLLRLGDGSTAGGKPVYSPNIPWTAFTPTITASAGTFTTVSGTGYFMVQFGICHFRVTLTVTTVGTGVSIVFTLPIAGGAQTEGHAFTAYEKVNTGYGGYARILAGLTTARVLRYDNGDIVSGNGSVINVNGSYPVA